MLPSFVGFRVCDDSDKDRVCVAPGKAANKILVAWLDGVRQGQVSDEDTV